MRTKNADIAVLPVPKLVTVAVDLGSGYGRGIFRGVSRYALAYTRWQVVPETPAELESQLRAGRVRVGALLQSIDPAREKFLHAQGLPVVNVSNYLKRTLFPRVTNDDEAVGRMGARYFLERGFRKGAWCGADGITLSALRKRGYVSEFEAGGGKVSCLDFSKNTQDGEIRAWLQSLPSPCGLMAFSDKRACDLLRIAQELGLEVPGKLAVLGVDNDELSEWAHPGGLSSVQTDGERVGQTAARTLHSLQRGEEVPAEQWVPPVGVVSRASTDLLAMEDPVMNRALRFIRAAMGSELQVDDVARHAGVSRRVLEMRFRKNLNRTVLGEIIRHRMEHAARLLRETDLSVEEIASNVGYAETRQLSTTFRKAMGCTPRDYRKQMRQS